MRVPGPGAGRGAAGPPPGPEVELSPALRRELLDPAAWQEGLEKYALAMHLAVALVGADGRLLGPCLSPQPLWRLLRARRPEAGGECPFALAPPQPCTCVTDALKKGRVVRARDRTGLAHFAVPLALGEQKLGALVAGQVFDHYPEQLPLEQVATNLGLSRAKVWQTARLEHPVSPSTLRVYEGLLTTLGQTLLQGRYHTLREASHLAELRQADEALRQANDELERRVEERTAALHAAQQQALRLERLAAIGQMSAGLAHESRNALQRGQACLERLRWKLQGQPEALDLLGRAQQAQHDLLRLYEDVREYAAPIAVEPAPCDLAAVWRQAWAEVLALAPGRDARLAEETAGECLTCEADGFRLGQVFRNLFENSLAACPGPVCVTVSCGPAELAGRPALRVAVRDDGPGFTEEQRRRMFEPFFTTKLKGTGLGLAIGKRIVEAHGGTVALGGAPGSGAEVVFTLPRGSP